VAAVSGVFTAARGVALGITLTGAAMAQILVPPISYLLIDNFGWREAYIILGLGWGAVVLLPVLFFLFDAHDRERKREPAARDDPEPRLPLTGLSTRAAIRSLVLWRIGIASFLTMLLGIGAIVHQVPILTQAGVTRANAAFLASLAGAAGIVGKLVTGWLMDRRDAGMIGGLTLAVGGVGFLLLLEPFRSPVLIIIAMFIIGYSTGSKLQISAYLTSRYGGILNFGKIFGVINGLIALGVGIGPVLAGAIYDTYDSYAPFLVVGIAGSIISGVLIIGLGPYPNWANLFRSAEANLQAPREPAGQGSGSGQR
jgi:predicted MFS family arabinose efflux permease